MHSGLAVVGGFVCWFLPLLLSRFALSAVFLLLGGIFVLCFVGVSMVWGGCGLLCGRWGWGAVASPMYMVRRLTEGGLSGGLL